MKNIKLFDYQEDMKERIEKALCLHRSVMAQMPTGTGKTVLLASVVESFLREHSNCNVWIVAHRRELVSQIRETIQRVFFESPRPSLAKEGDFSNHPVPLSKEGNFSKTHPSSLTLKGGSTSFPKPLSPQGTGDVTALRAEFFESPRPSLAKEGSTSHPSPLSSEERDVTALRCSEPLRSMVGGPSKVSPDCLCGVNRLGDGLGDRLGATCLRPADKVGDGLAATCLRPADELAPIQVLVNVDIFSEGFDCPDVEFVQLARPTLSLAKYLQMVGRGLRVAKGKKNCVIIDNVGLYRVFGLPSQVWNWNAMFEGKLKVGKKKETPKDREFFLMNKEQDGIRIHPDSEMMMVMSHEELLQTLQYREFVDSKGEFAIIKLPDGKMTVVNRHGEQVLEPGDYYDMKLLSGNILFYRPRRKAKCYYDLLAKAVIDDGTNVAEAPQVVNIKGWEFIEYNDIFMSRTQENFSLPYRPSQYDFLNYGYYMIFRFRPSAIGCQVWYYCEGNEGKMRMSNEESRNVCFLRNDYEHVYWLCVVLYGDCIVVMDSKQDYYLVDSYLKKTYIGCNNPKNENEDLHIVMPRLGKKYYDEMMLQEKKKEASEMILLHEKSVAGHVELYQAGKKWGIKVDGRVVVPPLYRSIAQPVGAYCAFEDIPRYWGIMTLKGKVIVDAKYEKVEIRDGGIAVVTDITGKTQTIHLK